MTLDLEDGVDASWTAVWEPDVGNAYAVTMVATDSRSASFTAPEVTGSIELTFHAVGCSADQLGDGLEGSVVVPV